MVAVAARKRHDTERTRNQLTTLDLMQSWGSRTVTRLGQPKKISGYVAPRCPRTRCASLPSPKDALDSDNVSSFTPVATCSLTLAPIKHIQACPRSFSARVQRARRRSGPTRRSHGAAASSCTTQQPPSPIFPSPSLGTPLHQKQSLPQHLPPPHTLRNAARHSSRSPSPHRGSPRRLRA